MLKRGGRIVAALILTLALLIATLPAQSAAADGAKFQMGFSYVAWWNNLYSVYGVDSLQRLRAIGVQWVSIYVTWYQDTPQSTNIYSDTSRSPTDSSLSYVIDAAHAMGLRVMLKPHVDIKDRTPRARIAPTDWNLWWNSYRQFIYKYASFAASLKVEQFCVGTELSSTQGFANEWQETISDIRARFSGALTYAATHYTYDQISWWYLLDYAGLNAWFTLSTAPTATLGALLESWRTIIPRIESWQRKIDRPVILTEIGYSSYNGTTMHPWKAVTDEGLDLDEQVIAYQAAFQSFFGKPWLRGMFWHYWGTRSSSGGMNDRGVVPQNKPAEQVVQHWYGLNWDSVLLVVQRRLS